MHMLQIEDTKVFTVVELKPKSIFRERGKHVKYVGFFFPGEGRRREGLLGQFRSWFPT